jgi:hydroxypyruvate reductase
MKQTVLLMGSLMLPPEIAALERAFDVIKLYKEPEPEAVLAVRSHDIRGIASQYTRPLPRSLMEGLPNLEIISQFGVGYDNIDMAAAKARGVAVTNTPDLLTEDTADTAMSLLLAVSRRICEGDMFVRVGKWQSGPLPLGRTLKGKTAGIVGLGRIGAAIARRCAAFDMDVVYYGRREKKGAAYPYYADLHAMAREVDYLILACPGGAETAGLIDATVMEALGAEGFLINIARGTVVDEPALVRALKEKTIAGAGLDVFIHEPNVPHELISMDNVVMTPHIGSATIETRTLMGRLVVANLMAHFEGKALLTPVV